VATPRAGIRRGGGRPPKRRLDVLFLGAGASKAARLPLTEELLERVWPRSGAPQWCRIHSAGEWDALLSAAVKTLYPQGGDHGFRPQVADFFTVLEVVAQVHEGRERLPIRAASLLADLRREIALGLDADVKALRDPHAPPDSPWPHREWTNQLQGIDVVITSNWDTLTEVAAYLQKREVRLLWPKDKKDRRINRLRSEAIVVLKLHGSTDWGLRESAIRRATPFSYSHLRTPVGNQERRRRGRWPNNEVLRLRSPVERPRALTGLGGFQNPLMATMSIGKANAIQALDDVWSDAYWCLSRAKSLQVIGYSFPTDDLEIRTLLRASTRHAGKSSLDTGLSLTVSNPSPEAHDRARSFLGQGLQSDYFGAS
jgi:hypothetical protein